MIPYRSVSRGMDLLLAIRPDLIRVNANGCEYETTRVLIGLNPVSLSSDGSYRAIIHPSLINDEFVRPGQEQSSQEAIPI